MTDHSKSFWTSLPGMLTAIITLLTALVGLITVLKKSAPAQPQPAAVAFLPAAISVAQPVKPQGCENAIGNWSWFIGGVVTVEKDGHLTWRKNPQDLFPSANGVWSCIDPKEQELTMTWQQTGMTDTLKISSDGRSISGTNYTGVRVTGTKL